MDFKWQEEFGGVVRIRAPFREDRLLISDPKALQYIHQSAGYRFCKAPGRISLSGLLLGPGIIAVDGEVHKRQRRIMQPGFGTSESKALVPIFFDHAKKMTSKWKDILADSKDQQAVFDLPGWISRAALDIIGEAAFDYHFGALDNSENELQKMYTNFVFDAFAVPTHSDILTWSIMDWLPGPILRGLLRSAPSPRLERRRTIRQMSTMVAKKLVTEKYNALAHGKPSKDIMSLLVKANASENPKKRLEDPEMWAQMNSIILAGQETTMSSMCWAFLELARHPEVQRRLRNEIRATEDRACTRDLTAADFESMPYLGAVIKEILRFHPVVYNSFLLPLHKPIVTQDGRTITELPIPKGIQIISSVAAYHRNTEIFGADAHTFNPTRWLDQTVKTPVSVGVYANLFTFVGGARSCIGWKFALLQMQTFVVELIGTFDLSLTSPSQTIRREACFVMTPTVEGEQEKGTQLNLLVKLAEDR
ncbi:cytochrome P450 [Mucidula mucida]|nr:cytochrome P450 [Mucidula mucida]